MDANPSQSIDPNQQLADDLRLQAWLMQAEQRNPSLHEHVKPLAQRRDDLRLQLHLGKMEATDAWHALEDRWQHLRHRLDVALRSDSENDLAKEIVAEIKHGYEVLTGRA